MRVLLFNLIFITSWASLGQSTHITGLLLDSADLTPIEFAHITNYSQRPLGTITNLNGEFNLETQVGDTLIFSIVGYRRLGWKVTEEWFDRVKTIMLPRETQLLDEVVVHQIPPEEIFKQKLLEYQPEDSTFWYHGIPKPIEREDPTLNAKMIRNPLYIVAHPLSSMYYNLSKQEKERRKFHRITQTEDRTFRVYEKFNRDWVNEVTGLSGDLLTDFIAYCDYSIDYLDKTPQYIIREDLLAKLTLFQKEQSG